MTDKPITDDTAEIIAAAFAAAGEAFTLVIEQFTAAVTDALAALAAMQDDDPAPELSVSERALELAFGIHPEDAE